MTIAGGVFAGLKRHDAAKFSFLLSVPTLACAGLLECKDALNATVSNVGHTPLLFGFLASFITGFLSIWFFFAIIKKAKFYYFALYCIAIGLIGLIFT